MNLRESLLLVSLVVTGFAPLAAQAAAPPKDPFKLTGDLGLVNESGNTRVTTFNFDERIDFGPAPWTFAQAVSTLYGKNDGVESAAEWHGLVRADRAFGDRYSAYFLTTFDRNTFAGIARRWEEGLGLGTQLLRAKRDTVRGELGVSVTQQRNTDDTHHDFPSARAAVTYLHAFTSKAFAMEGVEVLPDLNVGRNVRINSTTALVAPLSSHFALKVSYVVRFDNLPPPGFGRSDRLLTTGLQFVF